MSKGKIIKNHEKAEVTILGETYTLSAIPQDMIKACAFHGLCQKLGDTTAGMKDFSDTEKSAAIDKVYENLKVGLWRKPGEQAQTMKKKVVEAITKATKEELNVMVHLDFISWQIAEAELKRRATEATNKKKK